MCHCTEYELSAFQVRISEENTLNTTIQQFSSTKISGYALKQGVKHTHHCVRAIIYNCKMKLRKCLLEYEQWGIESVRLYCLTHISCLQDRILLNYTRIENVHKVCKKMSILCYV